MQYRSRLAPSNACDGVRRSIRDRAFQADLQERALHTWWACSRPCCSKQSPHRWTRCVGSCVDSASCQDPPGCPPWKPCSQAAHSRQPPPGPRKCWLLCAERQQWWSPSSPRCLKGYRSCPSRSRGHARPALSIRPPRPGPSLESIASLVDPTATWMDARLFKHFQHCINLSL